ncbi:hypothetical protein ACFZBU_14685 [Embleya sp. NPDC008237]|uniref:hypothetical protein n=1 Tax=Embleya sp. NPDC008237 TaxID=3363978 RepID=UPI0036E93DC0
MNDDEPILKRNRWGPSPYVFNVRNPIGLALTVITVVFVVVMLVLMNRHMGPFARPSAPERPPSEGWEWSPTRQPTPWTPPTSPATPPTTPTESAHP